MDSTILDLAAALGWGLVSVAGLAVGAFIGLYGSLKHRSVAATMAVAAGLLLAAATTHAAKELTHRVKHFFCEATALQNSPHKGEEGDG